MSGEQLRVVVTEVHRATTAQGSDREIYHLPSGSDVDEASWVPIWCGDGIAFPSSPRQVDQSLVCAECLSAEADDSSLARAS